MSSTLPPPPPPPPADRPASGARRQRPAGVPRERQRRTGPAGAAPRRQPGQEGPHPRRRRRRSGRGRGRRLGGVQLLRTGPQPAEALPAKTLGYASIDLDPSGGQKIEALKTLNKFPAFKDYVGINADDDLRKEIFERIKDQAHCDNLDYADDIEPWLGDRAAFAAVDVGDDDPDAVVVIQVKDADKADAGLGKIKDCGGSDDVGWAI